MIVMYANKKYNSLNTQHRFSTNTLKYSRGSFKPYVTGRNGMNQHNEHLLSSVPIRAWKNKLCIGLC